MAKRQEEAPAAPAESALVDESLVDAVWALSPVERLRQNDRTIRMVELLKEGLGKARGTDHGGR